MPVDAEKMMRAAIRWRITARFFLRQPQRDNRGGCPLSASCAPCTVRQFSVISDADSA